MPRWEIPLVELLRGIRSPARHDVHERATPKRAGPRPPRNADVLVGAQERRFAICMAPCFRARSPSDTALAHLGSAIKGLLFYLKRMAVDALEDEDGKEMKRVSMDRAADREKERWKHRAALMILLSAVSLSKVTIPLITMCARSRNRSTVVSTAGESAGAGQWLPNRTISMRGRCRRQTQCRIM
ncbi:hypothetical protein BU23DRAFT_203398 [Bimuria novae-zelandiae CBS 107.79]|uniref:Uncharacterized protein n=1 Tax=Bimuria novae-zelandiae CBS 107.79 TaxID=1447943 RepID=A0A6A5V0Q3_9PLEO|nr:hypothetical protein BU23DRAFT_203398 [Bimuria novae-zelandiae CBS 107.79]